MGQAKMIELCEEIISYASKVVALGRQKEKHIVFDTCMSLCNRTRINVESILILLPSYFQNNELELSIGLLLRNNLLDHLTLNFLINKRTKLTTRFKEKEFDFEEYKRLLKNEFENLLYDQFNKIIGYAKTQDQLGIKSKNEWNSVMQAVIDKEQLPINLNNLNAYEGPNLMYKESFKNDRTMESTSVSYDLYHFYSKYEHFGYFSDILVKDDKNVGRLGFSLSISFLTICEAAIFIGEVEMAKEIDVRMMSYAGIL